MRKADNKSGDWWANVIVSDMNKVLYLLHYCRTINLDLTYMDGQTDPLIDGGQRYIFLSCESGRDLNNAKISYTICGTRHTVHRVQGPLWLYLVMYRCILSSSLYPPEHHRSQTTGMCS